MNSRVGIIDLNNSFWKPNLIINNIGDLKKYRLYLKKIIPDELIYSTLYGKRIICKCNFDESNNKYNNNSENLNLKLCHCWVIRNIYNIQERIIINKKFKNHYNYSENAYITCYGDIINDRYRVIDLISNIDNKSRNIIYKCYDIEDNKLVSLKIANAREKDYIFLNNEINILNKIKNDDSEDDIVKNHIQEILDHFYLPSNCWCSYEKHACLVSPLYGTDLYSFIKLNGRIHYDAVKIMMFQIANVLDYIHDKINIIHNDLKPENILFKYDILSTHNSTNQTFDEHIFDVVLIDFGCCREKDEYLSNSKIMGTYYYTPPEKLVQNSWNEKVDIFSFGLIFVELLQGHDLLSNSLELNLVIMSIIMKDFPKDFILNTNKNIDNNCLLALLEDKKKIRDHYQRKIKKNYLEKYLLQFIEAKQDRKEFKKLIDSCFKYIPSDRPNARQIIKAEIFSSFFKDYVDEEEINIFDDVSDISSDDGKKRCIIC